MNKKRAYVVRSCLAMFLGASLLLTSAIAAPLTIAAASSMRFVLPQLIEHYQTTHEQAQIRVVYGSSGRLYGQITHGAPFHLFLSANMEYAEQLLAAGYGSGTVQPYTEGRLVLWWQAEQEQGSQVAAAEKIAELLAQPHQRLAIANPDHAPYGVQSLKWLQQHSAWAELEPRLVYTESVAQVAHFVRSGAASMGILALALAVTEELEQQGHYALLPPDEYQALRKGMVLTKAGATNALAQDFFTYLQSDVVQQLLLEAGFAQSQP